MAFLLEIFLKWLRHPAPDDVANRFHPGKKQDSAVANRAV